MRRWAAAHPDWAWAPEPGTPLVYAERVAALAAAVAADAEPAVLVAHSAGCVTAVQWAATGGGVRGALLVAPPCFEGVAGAPEVPLAPLPFPAVLVASRTDPYCDYEDAEAYALAWGARLVDAGDAGHVDTKTGYGPWPDGEALIAALLES
ncbi:serine hydrolase family protein [Glycomyces paridis]|uniref:Serine hydrolase family protein n=2 Tax=Glycomyces paridis TaxID=2126555 RepID=A0A4S8PAX4_9ACTN|nr:serine hydrolase family protein [Glycomyces paridis]